MIGHPQNHNAKNRIGQDFVYFPGCDTEFASIWKTVVNKIQFDHLFY